MSTALAPSPNQEEIAKLQQIRMQNQLVLDSTQWQWTKLANSLGSSNAPNYATDTLYKFTLANTSAYIKALRVWLGSIVITNSATVASPVNRNGIYQLLGSFQVRLGNNIYRLPASAIPLIIQTMNRDGRTPDYRGQQSYSYSTNLFDAPTSVAASTTTTFKGYLDIPLALLAPVKDPDGIAPTLSNTGMEVEFTTPSSLTGADPFLAPFGTGGTLSVTSGTVEVHAQVARQITVSDSGPLPGFVVGPAFVFEDVPQAFVEAETFYPFQGQQANLILLKTIAVIDSPGELAQEFSNPTNIARLDLMYDADTPVYEDSAAQEPQPAFAYPANFLVDSGQAIGDQPPGVYVYDWSRGTNANYPNSMWYWNLEKFSRGGLRIRYNVAPQTGAQIHFINVYLRPKFYQAKATA